MHGPASGTGVRIDPGGNRAACCGCLQGAGNARQADAAAAGFHFHRAGNVHDPDTTATGLGMNRTAHFAEIDLAAAGVHADEIAGMRNGDVAANGFQIGASRDLTGTDMTAAGTEGSISGNVADLDVSAAGKGGKTTGDVFYLNVSALSFQFGSQTPDKSFAKPRTADSAGLDVSALGAKASSPANIAGRDVACSGVHFDAVPAGNSHFKLNPELRIGGARGLRREYAGNFHTRVIGFGFQGVIIEELLCCLASCIGFDADGVAHHRCGTGLKLGYLDGTEVGRQPQRQTIPGIQNACADGSLMCGWRISRTRGLDRARLTCGIGDGERGQEYQGTSRGKRPAKSGDACRRGNRRSEA